MASPVETVDVGERIAALDWERLAATLDARGAAVTPPLLPPDECAGLVALYGDETRFRKRIEMARHGYGEGDYQYFARPLPPLVEALRAALYPPLAATANRWAAALGLPERYPAALAEF